MSKIIVVFIEKIYKEEDTNGYYLLLDFPTKNGNENIFYERISLDRNEEKSMLEVRNVNFTERRKPLEGHYYELPNALLSATGWSVTPIEDEQLSSYIALWFDAKDIFLEFANALTYNVYSEQLTAGTLDETTFEGIINKFISSQIKEENEVEISVYDVGQGNWNEILFNENFLIIYDLGASSSNVFKTTYNRVALPQNRRFTINSILEDDYQLKKILIISHWDIDHYNGIFELDDSVIQSFDFCVVPKQIENETIKRAFKKLSQTTVYPIEMNAKKTGRGGASKLTKVYSNDFLKIYKGTKCSDRNKRGLLLSLHVNNIDFIFPADHHYSQIDNYLIGNCINNELNFVIPHHGGAGGTNLSISTWRANKNNAIISSGGRYGHPSIYNLTAIESAFSSVHRTDTCTNINCNNPTHGATLPFNCGSSDYSRTI